MGPTTSSIHFSWSYWSISVSYFHHMLYLCIRAYRVFSKPIYKNPYNLWLPHSQPASRTSIYRDEQILYPLIVNLEHTNSDLISQIGVLIWRNPSENFLWTNWHYSSICPIPNHTVTLPTASLSIRKKTTMITFPCIIQNLLP